MALVWLILFGFVVGLVARAIMPGPQPMGFLMTSVLGISGSVVGGLLTGLFFGDFGRAHFIGSVIGALLVMGVAGATRRRMLM